MSRLRLLAILLLAGCEFSPLRLPPEPAEVGEITGRLVVFRPGLAAPQPAEGARVQILRTNVRAESGADGRFRLSPIPTDEGVLLVQFEQQADGTFARQRLLNLRELGAGPGRIVSTGDIVLRENAAASGRVLLGDRATERSGHRGVTVFLPEGPFTTYSGDDGAYLFGELPEGDVTLMFFKEGYAPALAGPISLRSGESITLRDVVLEKSDAAPPLVTVEGVVRTDPVIADLSAARVLANGALGETVLTVGANGAFSGSLPAGLYTFTFTHEGYAPVTVANVFLPPGSVDAPSHVTLPTVTLAAEQPQPPEEPVLAPPPVIGLVSPAYGAVGARFVLDASTTVGAPGHPLAYRWRQTAGDPVVLERNGTSEAVRTGFAAPAHPDTLAFELEVEDTATGRKSDTLVQVAIVEAPVAEVVAPAFVRTGAAVTLDATSSTAPHAIHYAWRQRRGDPVALPADGPNASRATFEAPATPQLLAFELTVTDATSGLTAVATVQLEIAIPPSPQIAADALGRTGETFRLDATLTTGAPGHALLFAWRQLSGPVVAIVADDASGGARASFIAPATPVRVVIELSVTDADTGLGAATSTTVDFDDAPVARITSPTAGQAGARFELDASRSLAPPGHTLSYTWTQDAGDAVTLSANASPEAGRVAFTAPLAPQVLSFTVTVLDTRTRFATSATTTITFQSAPFALARAPARVQSGASVQLDASASSGPVGHALAYSWRQSRGDSVALADNDSPDAVLTTFRAPTRPQFLAFDLTVIDLDTGLAATSGVVIEVQQPPTALIAPPGLARTGGVMRLDGSGSTSPLGAPLLFQWTQTDGDSVQLSDNGTAFASTPSFAVPMRHQLLGFTLVVTDLATNLSAETTTTVQVLPPPEAVVEPAAIVVRPGATFRLDGTGSRDPLGAPIVGYRWTLLPPGTDATLDNPTASTVLVTAGQTAFAVQLAVSTARLTSDPASVVVQLNPTAVIRPTLSLSAGLLEVGTGATVTLVATAASPDPSESVTVQWSQAAGPATPLLVTTGANGTSTAVFRAPDSAATLIFDITATGSGGGVTTKSVTVEVDDVTPPAIVRSAPATDNGAGPAFYASVQFDEDVDPATLLPANVHVLDSQGNRVAGDIGYDPGTRTVRLIYDTALTAGGRYTLELVGVRDRSPNANPMPTTRLTFGAASPRWDLYTDPTGATSTTPNRPWILWSRERVSVIGQRTDTAACPGATYGFVYALDVTGADRLTQIDPGACRGTDHRNGDFGPNAVQAGAEQFAYSWNGVVYKRLGNAFLTEPNTCCQVGTDGTSMFSLQENYGIILASWNATTSGWNPATRVDGRAGTWVGHRATIGGDGTLAYIAGPNAAGVTLVARRNANGTWTVLPSVGGTGADEGNFPRVRVRNGLPVLVTEERVAGTWKVRAYQGSTSGTTLAWRQLGGGDVNVGSVTQSDGAIVGNTLYVAMAAGGVIRVRHVVLDDPAAKWVDDLGPDGPHLNVDATCTADRPSLDAAPDGLWLAWSENCVAGTARWKVYARKLTSGPSAPTFPMPAGNPRLVVDAAARLVGTGESVTLAATAEQLDPTNALSFQWEQLGGTAVTLNTTSAPTTSSAQFTAPAKWTTLTFRVTAYGARGGSAERIVTVEVEDRTKPRVLTSSPAIASGPGPMLAATVTFDEPVDPATLTGANLRIENASNQLVPATVTFTPPATARVTYASPLTPGASYTLKLSGVADASPTHNVMLPVDVAFSAAPAAWTLYTDPSAASSTVSNRPWILSTPTGLTVVGDRLDTVACPGAPYGFLWNLDVREPGTLVPIGASQCRGVDYRNGDFGARGVAAGGRVFAYSWNGAVYVRNADAWAPAGTTCCQLVSDGGSPFSLQENYGVILAAFDPQANAFGAFARIDGNAGTWRGHRMSGAGAEGAFYIAGSVLPGGATMVIRREPGGTWTNLGRTSASGTSDSDLPRVAVHQGRPVIVANELMSGSWRVRAYEGSGEANVFRLLGGANVNASGSVTQFDGALVGETLYVAMNVSNAVVLRRVDLVDAAATWVDVPGPGGGATLNENPGCIADRPTVAATADGLYVAWSENCDAVAPKWRVKVRALR